MKTLALTLSHLLLACCLFSSAARADVVAQSSFDNDLDGWVSSLGSPSDIDWVASGGSPSGFLRFRQLPRSGPAYIFAPAKFLGNWSSLDGVGIFSFDQRVLDPGTTITGVQQPTLRISGPGGAAIAVFPRPPVTATPWQTFSVSIEETTFTMLSGTWSALLTNITDLRIKVELFDNSGLPDSTGTDTIVLSRTFCAGIPSTLAVSFYPGITLDGTVGCTYRVEYSETVDGTNWVPVGTVRLTQTPYLFFDTTWTNSQRRFYRAVQ